MKSFSKILLAGAFAVIAIAVSAAPSEAARGKAKAKAPAACVPLTTCTMAKSGVVHQCWGGKWQGHAAAGLRAAVLPAEVRLSARLRRPLCSSDAGRFLPLVAGGNAGVICSCAAAGWFDRRRGAPYEPASHPRTPSRSS